MADEVPRGRLRRLGKVVGMTARVGTGLVRSGVKRAMGDDNDVTLEAAKRVLETLGDMKGAALKFGQMMSLGAGHLPPEVRKVVGKLFSQAPSLDYDKIAEVVRQELGGDPKSVFAEFDETPFAAASLGQVHRARTHEGVEVAVKVQYPGIGSAIEDDMRNAGLLVKTLSIGSNLFDNRAYFDELKHELTLELDYTREIKLAEEFRAYVKPWPELVVPKTFPELSTSKVLTLEKLEGQTLHAFADSPDATPEDRFRVGIQMSRAIYAPFILHRVIHGDTHPGNFIVRPDGTLGVLDFGSIKHFSEPFHRCYMRAIDQALSGAPFDLLPVMRAGGFTIGIPDDRAQNLLNAMADIITPPLRGTYDFGEDTIADTMRAFVMKNTPDLLRVRPPAESVLFYRAIAGATHNLRALRARGDFRPLFEELLERRRGMSDDLGR
jgi:predicted unusual protein kinase regulating ubiquinone biosynthesis (AarF/ABC1/UbiB family)